MMSKHWRFSPHGYYKKRLLVEARGHGARFAQSASEGLRRVMTAQRLSRLVDDSAAKRVAGFVQTVRKGDFLAVVVRDEWSAIKTANAIKADRAPRRTLPEAANVFSAWPAFKPSKVDVHRKAENIDSAIGGAAKRISARYEFGIQTHASLGPSGAVAEVRDGRLTV